jgi:hypothetical protein
VIRDAVQLAPQYDAVVLTTRESNQLGMLYLFWGQVDPRAYFAASRRVRIGREWDFVAQIGKFHFRRLEQLDAVAQTLPCGAWVLVAERPGVSVPGRELKRYYYPSGAPALVLYEVNAISWQRRLQR